MVGIDDATNEPHSLHFPNSSDSSMREESNSMGGQHDFCIRRVLQVCPNVDRRQLHSFIKNSTHKNPYIIVDHALSAIRSGSISLEVSSPGSCSGKRKRANEEQCGVNEPLKRVKVDDVILKVQPQKGGPDYVELAVSQLHEDFSYVEERFIRAVFTSLGSFYAPTHLFLLAKEKEVLRRLHLTAVPPVPNLAKSDKGKRRALEDAQFNRERKWLLELLANQEKVHAQVVAEGETSQDQIEVVDDEERMIECGCCFTEHPFNNTVSCPDNHMFCYGCISTHCSNLLLVQKSRIPCMSTEGCESSFSASTLRRALDEKQFSAWERLDQRREIAAAGLVLEECPFCEFACVISDDQVTVFVCGNTEKCGKESCRGCKKLNHLPKTCQEVRDDEIREGRHTIAEAMSRALMRNCPKCLKPFIKDDGCNKITCPSCGTLSCYICRKAIAGYDHFDSNQQGRRKVRKSNGKCPLFDAEADRHNNDVIQAAAAALEQVKHDLPNVEQDELQVDLPPPPRQKPAPRPARPRILGRRLPYPVLPNNQPIPGILQQAAPLLALAPQPIIPIGLMHNQPFAPQIGPIGPPGVFGNTPLPILQQQQFMPAQAHNVSEQPGFNMVPTPPQFAVAPQPVLPLHRFPPYAPPLPSPPPPLQPPLHIHNRYDLDKLPISPPELLALYGPPALTTPSPVQQLNNLSHKNRLQTPGPALLPQQAPGQPIDGISPMLLYLSAPPLQTQHQQTPLFTRSS